VLDEYLDGPREACPGGVVQRCRIESPDAGRAFRVAGAAVVRAGTMAQERASIRFTGPFSKVTFTYKNETSPTMNRAAGPRVSASPVCCASVAGPGEPGHDVGRSPEEFELDVVWIAEGDHGVGGL
jgi:hypothetical protein